MDLYRTADSWTGVPGAIAPADCNLAAGVAPGFSTASRERGEDTALKGGATTPPADFGPNNERLEDVKPELVQALRELVRQISPGRHRRAASRNSPDSPGAALLARLAVCLVESQRHELAPAIRAALQQRRELEEMPRYQFVTNFYQGFGLSFIACCRRTCQAK